ncbi:MAG: aspartate--tRNA(Asn) ligase [Candidatus Ryanbacteria bacterium RIFCSPHIGHO2_02_FULL_47_25]|nr:MAG: aspartate--tRNA(Asn) ligase [Candidatus Ryanbacteria bacterium RIFCSPHIGHO2_02_FULL_47_25]
MERVHISEIKKYVGQQVKIAGFVQIIRDQGSIKFLIIRDISGIIQVVITKASAEAMATAESLSLESVVEIIGLAKEEKQAPDGIEIAAENISVLSLASPELPIPVNEKGQEETDIQKRLDWRWLDLRKPEKSLIFKVWTLMEQSFREYWTQNGYIEIHSPKFMSTPSESGAELFEVKYFDRKAYLAQSPQFYKQMAIAAGFEQVFEIGPVFRANPSFTSRHDTEFTGYDAEISFIESHQEVMQEESKIIQYILERIKERYGKEILALYGRDLIVPAIPFPQVTMEQAKEILKKLGIPSEKDGDLSPEEERKLSEYIMEKEGHEFVFVTEYPIEVRPFYHMRLKENPKLTKSFDLLWNGLEITTGAQREHRYDILVTQAEEKGLRLEPIQFYLNFFKYGCPPHGGFGLGPSRMLMKMFNVGNVREVTYLYRGVKRLEP